MKTIIFNDTSRFHHGCSAVMRVLLTHADMSGLDVIETVYGNTWLLSKSYPIFDHASLSQADVIILNGEGTMHDDARLAKYYLDCIFKYKGTRKFALINSLWQRMSPVYADLMKHADIVTVREPKSKKSLGMDSAFVMPDLSYYEVPPHSRVQYQGFLKGTFYKGLFKEIKLDGKIDITRENWGVVVNKLRYADACLTGKHHEVMACCIARCPFVTPLIETHKISGLGDFIGQKLLEVAPNEDRSTIIKKLSIARADKDGTYRNLFDCLENIRDRIKLSNLFEKML